MNFIGDNIKKIENVFDICKDSYFFIQVKNEVEKFKSNLIKNKINYNNDSLICLKKEISDITKNEDNKKEDNKINILSAFYDSINNIKEIDKEKSVYAQNIKIIFDNYNSEKCITLKYIQKEYEFRYHKHLSLMTISRILRRHLKFHFRKTVVKNPKLKTDNYIIMSYIFIFGIIKAIENNLDIIFIDECGFELSNNNLYIWRKNDDVVIGGPKIYNKKRINLILSTNKKGIILGHYYNNETIGTNEFLLFIKELLNEIGRDEIKNKIFVLDNATYHFSENIKKYAEKEKLKFLFNVPYKSEFNGIELVFNLIKSHLYNEIHKNLKELTDKIVLYIDDKDINNNIIKVYKKTFEEYVKFFEANLNVINSLKFENNKNKAKRKNKNYLTNRKIGK